jgi:hypothetical protein
MRLLVYQTYPVSIRRGNTPTEADSSQRLTYQEVVWSEKGSIDKRAGSQKRASDGSLPFLNTLSLTKTNSHEQRNTVGGVNTNPPSVQSHKTNLKFFGGIGDTINPRLSDDNQSGASVDSASRKRRMVTVNPIEYMPF